MEEEEEDEDPEECEDRRYHGPGRYSSCVPTRDAADTRVRAEPVAMGCGVLSAGFRLRISAGKSGEFRLYRIVLVLYFCRSVETLLGYDLLLPAFFGVRVFSRFPPLGFRGGKKP